MSFRSLITTGALLAVASSPALSASAVWDSPALPASTVLAEWNVFDSATTDETPDVAGAGTLSQLSPAAGSFLTSSGNLYSAGGAATFLLTVDQTLLSGSTVWLRTAVQGTVLDSLATLNGVAADKVVSFSSALGGFGGTEEESYWVWTLTGAVDVLQFGFGSSAAHTSLDQVAVLAAPVPEPSVWLSLVAGLGILGAVARRRS